MIDFEVTITPPIGKITRENEARFKIVNGRVVDSLLDAIEQAQIKSYTSTAKPRQPAGTKYRRTFALQRSSERHRGRVTARDFNAVWRSDLGYARFVIGSKSDQAAIHRNRWKPLETVVTEVGRQVSDIYDKHFDEVF